MCVRACTHTQLSGQNLNVSAQLRSVIGRTPRMSSKMFQTLSDAPPPVCFQFDSVADISDVSSNVTLKSYTMHFEVARSASAWPLCMACGLRGRKGCFLDGPSRMPVPRMLATQRVCLSHVKIGPCLFCILASCNKGNGQGWVRREACMRRRTVRGFAAQRKGTV